MRSLFIETLMRQARVVLTRGIQIADMPSPNNEEYWHNVGETGEVEFLNGWENYSIGDLPDGMNPLGYRRDNSGFVHLRGVIQARPSGSGDDIFTLPAGWRPPFLTSLSMVQGYEYITISQFDPSHDNGDGTFGAVVTENRPSDNYPFNNTQLELFIHADGNVALPRTRNKDIHYVSLDSLKFRAY